jgi:hypothetical protein
MTARRQRSSVAVRAERLAGGAHCEREVCHVGCRAERARDGGSKHGPRVDERREAAHSEQHEPCGEECERGSGGVDEAAAAAAATSALTALLTNVGAATTPVALPYRAPSSVNAAKCPGGSPVRAATDDADATSIIVTPR